MQAISREALPQPATPKRVTTLWSTKLAFIYVKRAKAKTVSYSTLGFQEYGMANASRFRFRFRFIYLVILQTQETSAKTKSGRCRRGHLEKNKVYSIPNLPTFENPKRVD